MLDVVAENLNLSVFLVGFTTFSGCVAAYSWRLSGVIAGSILMLLASYPYLASRKS